MAFVARRRDRPAEPAQSPRAEWYDRNPTQAAFAFDSLNVPAHGSTVRGSCTIPTGKKGFIAYVEIDVRRRSAATTLGTVLGYLTWVGQYTLRALHENNTVDSRFTICTHCGGILLEGQTASIVTQDASTGGSMDYFLSVTLLQFDA